MKKKLILLMVLIYTINLTACVRKRIDSSNVAVVDENVINNEKREKLHDDIAVGEIRNVSINGNAKSIVIRQGRNEYFEFFNKDLNTAHSYDVQCDKKGDTLEIHIVMENDEGDNNILGSVVIDIPKKEFEKIEVGGDFNQISTHALQSDVYINDCKSFVVLDLVTDRLNHSIILNGSESNVFRGVSVYFDKSPENISMKLNLIQDGIINDPQNILKNNVLETGTGKPVISIDNTKEVNVYTKE